MNDHIMSENKVKKRTYFLENCEGHSLYMIDQGTVYEVWLTKITKKFNYEI